MAIDPYNAPFLSPAIKEWWAYVIVAPLDNKITVFNNGNSKGFIGSIPAGGHWPPNSIPGVNELWKKAQNIDAKNNPSERMNKKTP